MKHMSAGALNIDVDSNVWAAHIQISCCNRCCFRWEFKNTRHAAHQHHEPVGGEAEEALEASNSRSCSGSEDLRRLLRIALHVSSAATPEPISTVITISQRQ
mmetsp:Transcript_105003/g.338600  ORF Transcript_105003/g.338600 Transcript_105003/m.338600 type:complete len:102 (-) Transcript_105003:574-879(-)